jgi:hypothetical protein
MRNSWISTGGKRMKKPARLIILCMIAVGIMTFSVVRPPNTARAASPITVALGADSATCVTGSTISLDASITVQSTDNITGGSVNINGFVAGDSLAFTNQPGVTGSYNASNGILTITGTASAAAYQDFLRSVTFYSPAPNGSRTLEILLSNTNSSALFCSATGHFYEYVSAGMTWTDARAAAAARTYPYGGVDHTGYLVTITSQTENDFITQKLASDAWIGASDAESEGASEGTWKWVTGHESGTSLAGFEHWNGGEPNDSGGNEDYGEIYCSGATKGFWNDLNGTQSLGYVVEYGTDVISLGSGGSAAKTITITSVVPPAVTTAAVTDYTASTAVMGGSVTSDGGGAITGRGVVFSSTDATPSLEESSPQDSNGTGSGPFSETIPALNDGTTYYVRAYATNSAGTAYGEIVTFTTNRVPTLTSVSLLAGAVEDTAYTIDYAALADAANEADDDGDTLVFRIESVSSGTLTKDGLAVTPGTTVLSSGESLVWTPAANANGSLHAFTVKAYDGRDYSAAAVQVAVSTTAVNDAPTITVNSGLTIQEDASATAITGAALVAADVEGDSLTYTVTDLPEKGTLYIDGAAMVTNGTFTPADLAGGLLTYTPYANQNGADSFAFTVSDGFWNVATSFNIAITPVNDAPVLTANTGLTTDEDQAAAITVAALGAVDIDSVTLTYTVTTAPLIGTLYKNGVALDSGGTFTPADIVGGLLTYTPDANQNGPDSFAFTVSDGTVTIPVTESYTFSIAIIPVNDAPAITVNSGLAILEDATATAIAGTLAAADVEGDSLTYTVAILPIKGTIYNDGAAMAPDGTFTPADLADGSITYAPGLNQNGSDSFEFTVSDGALTTPETETCAFNIAVAAVNDAPVITSGPLAYFISGMPGTAYTANGSDVEDDTIAWSIGGTDAALFAIDSASGALAFLNRPDAYAPMDSNHNNVYDLLLTAHDGTDSVTREISVIVIALPDESDAEVEVNGEAYTVGTTKTGTNEYGQTKETVTVDSEKLGELLGGRGPGATVTIPVTGGTDVAAGTLTGDMVDTMETMGATLEIRTETAAYALPAAEIDIGAVSVRLGENVALTDITVEISIGTPAGSTAAVVADSAAAGGFSLVVPAVDFTITCTYNGQTVAVDAFSSYVTRTIKIPDGTDPAKITTAIVVAPDGSVRHVPTKITVIGGAYYAVINSLTNSTYTVIWHPVEYADVAGHWAEDAINDMGSRLVVTGGEDGNFEPDRTVTRAEFTAFVIRALGLGAGSGENGFADLPQSGDFSAYIDTAVAYGLVTGYGSGMLAPDDVITREQAMVIISRAMTLTRLSAASKGIVTLPAKFLDTANVSPFAAAAVAACLKTGIIVGKTPDALCPKDDLTRAEAAVLLRRLLQYSGLI